MGVKGAEMKMKVQVESQTSFSSGHPGCTVSRRGDGNKKRVLRRRFRKRQNLVLVGTLGVQPAGKKMTKRYEMNISRHEDEIN